MDEKEIIEHEFSKMQHLYKNTNKKGSTGCQAVLRFMVENYSHKKWWWSWEFIGKKTEGGIYLSHRSPARASDLAILHPELVEDRKIGRYKVYRVRRENRQAVINYLK